jgi:hypothetical protein
VAAAQPFPVAENERPGTSAWRITDLGPADAIDGYADQQSVLPGQSFRLYVSTTAKSFRVDAFRFGWYSGHQARLVPGDAERAGRCPQRRHEPGLPRRELHLPARMTRRQRNSGVTRPAQDNVAQVNPPRIPALYDGVD